jgi:hypothetical protein
VVGYHTHSVESSPTKVFQRAVAVAPVASW